MRTPANAAEVRSMEKAYTSSDPFAIGKHERPGFKLIRVVDQRTRGNLGCTFVLAVPPESEAFALLPNDQTVNLTDVAPDGRHEPGA